MADGSGEIVMAGGEDGVGMFENGTAIGKKTALEMREARSAK